MCRRRSGKSIAVARQSPPARFGIAPRLAACRRRPARRQNGRPVRLAHRCAVFHPPIRVRFHRTPEPAGVLPHVRLRQPEHAHARAPANHRPATGAVPDEQPVRNRASQRSWPPQRSRRQTPGGWGRAAGEPPRPLPTSTGPNTASRPRSPHQSHYSAAPSAANQQSTN